MRNRAGVWALVLTCGAVVSVGVTAGSSGDGLKRRAYLGAALGPVADEARKDRGTEGGAGAAVRSVVPGSAAEAAGLRPGDVVLKANGVPVRTPAELVSTVARGKDGDILSLELTRAGTRADVKVTLKERPREASDRYDTVYGSIVSRAGRQRTILTRPKGPGRHPALLFVQGIGCYSVESLPGQPAAFQRIADDFTGRGYVTLRVEKPGVGDSEGGPCQDVDFETELDGYRQALGMLKRLDSVDPDRVILFGHSLGGLWAPVLASEVPVRGVAVYGTVLKPWYEYELENRRRQLILTGADYPSIDREMRAFATFLHALYIERKAPEKAVEGHPELEELRREMIADGTHIYGRNLAFLRQVAALPTSEYWSKVDAAVLAAWGKADYVSTETDHRMIADLVNRRHAGRGTFLALEGMDHGFSRASSPEERFRQARSGGPSEFNPGIIEALRAWADPLVLPAS
jgi:dienelactone hydrolase